jgi:hypothetical protein
VPGMRLRGSGAQVAGEWMSLLVQSWVACVLLTARCQTTQAAHVFCFECVLDLKSSLE